MCPRAEVSGHSLRQAFSGAQAGREGTSPETALFLLWGSCGPQSQARAEGQSRSRGSCPAPLTKTPLPSGAWEPSVTVYTQLKIPTENGSAQETWGGLRGHGPQRLWSCRRTRLESLQGRGSPLEAISRSTSPSRSLSHRFKSLPACPAPRVVGQYGQEGPALRTPRMLLGFSPWCPALLAELPGGRPVTARCGQVCLMPRERQGLGPLGKGGSGNWEDLRWKMLDQARVQISNHVVRRGLTEAEEARGGAYRGSEPRQSGSC